MNVATSCRTQQVHSAVTGPGEVVVTLSGRVDRRVAVEASGMIRGLVALGAKRLTVDLAKAYDIDVRLLTVLARVRTTVELTITGVVVPELLPALRDAGPDEAFVIYEAVRG